MSALYKVATTVIPTHGVGIVNAYPSGCGKCVSKLAFSLDHPENRKQSPFMQKSTELLAPKFVAAFLALILSAQISSAQWIAYNFTPQAAYLASYGLKTNTNSTSATILTNGWPTNWNNSTNRGVLVVQFSTNTNTPNVMTCLTPLVYLFSTNTNILTTNNYQTNTPQLALTNTNATGANSFSNVCYISRANFSRNIYMAGQYSLVTTNAGTNVGTNTVGTFFTPCSGYTTSNIGTNGVPTGTNYYPAILQLKISSINGSNAASSFNQQLVLPLTINTALTKIINTNAAFGSAALTNTNVMYTNLVKCIRSNSTYINP
jgi:hypothetical protein